MRSAASILSLVLGLACAALPLFAQETADGGSFTFRWRHGELDLTTNQNSYSGIVLTDGNLAVADNGDVTVTDATFEIRAERGLTDANSRRWQLMDEILVVLGTTEIRADSAVFEFEGDEFLSGEIEGSPIVLTDFIEERGTTVRASAERISYDGRSRTLSMVGGATFTSGANEFRGGAFVYNLQDKTVKLDSTELRFSTPQRDTPPENQPAIP